MRCRALVVVAILVGAVSAPAAAQIKTEAGASPGSVAAPFSDTGSVEISGVNFSATVTAAIAMSNVIVDLEIRDSSNVKISQNAYFSQNFTAGQTQSYNWSTKIPSNITPGTYYFVVAVFSPDWSTAYLWDRAVQLTVKP
jgi:hypothetical protein